jgi:ADP-heptose:LPS heptosyltransferase
MKILLLSLLRLGDILMHRQVVRNLKRQYPNAKIHMLIHSQFQSVQNLLPEVDQWHVLDRNEMQKILVERLQSPIVAFEKLQAVVCDLNSHKFDVVFNLTHNRFSVRLMDLIQASDKRGVALHMGRKTADANPWQSYLNENFSELNGSRFHYLEVLQKSLGIEVGQATAGESRKSQLILLQLLTADEKKNWGLGRFAELKKKLEAQFPEARILGICSPQEKDRVSEVFAWTEFLTPTLDEAARLLNEASLLITGDTSIQHLAAQQGCPVVSLFLGSADPVKTAPWQEGAWVVQGQVACSPCAHSSPCHQARHLCAESLKVETVFSFVTGILKGEEVKLFDSSMARTVQTKTSFRLERANESLLQIIENEVWSQYLNGSNEPEISNFSIAEMENLLKRHMQFEIAVRSAKAKVIQISDIEKAYPEWADGLIRWKRDFGFTAEIEAICQIRQRILYKCLQTNMENKNVRSENTRSAAQDRLAEA